LIAIWDFEVSDWVSSVPASAMRAKKP